MTAPTTRRSARAGRGRRFAAILGYTLQSCVPPKRWAAVPAAVRRRAAVRPARPRRRRSAPTRAFANVAAEGIFGLVDADRRARHRRRGARRRGARRHVPLHVAVARADVADRARALARRLGRRARDDRAGVRARRGRRRRARRTRWPAFVAAARRQRSPTSRCSSPSAASPGARRCGRWRSCSSSSGCSARRSPASPSSRRRGSRGRSSSASPTTPRGASSATASRAAAAPSSASRSSPLVVAGDRQLADAADAPGGRVRLTRCDERCARHAAADRSSHSG